MLTPSLSFVLVAVASAPSSCPFEVVETLDFRGGIVTRAENQSLSPESAVVNARPEMRMIQCRVAC
jgi:hypothetical protein